jgi:sterol desaturase/sphingolipid hydroxylase (fatty acid hydroxylase superfamily)
LPQRGSPRYFGLESLIYSASNYRFMLVADITGAATFLALGLMWFSGSSVAGAAVVGVGFFAWGGVEYAVHRWVLHGGPSMATRAHARHHADAEALISMPAFISPALAVMSCFVLSAMFGKGLAALAVFGLYAGYNYYAALHHLLHRQQALVDRIAPFARLEEAHRVHHRRVAVNYGVSTTWWDRLLGSYQPPPRLDAPVTPPAEHPSTDDGSSELVQRLPSQ